MMGRWVFRIAVFCFLLTGGMVAYGYYSASTYLDAPIGAAGETRRFTIPTGATFKQVVQVLGEAGVVTETHVFEMYGRVEKADRGVKAGTYAIDLGLTPRALLEKLKSGGLVPQVRVTIPEGYNRWQIADVLADEGLVEREAFLDAVDSKSLEGRLFPDTYWIRKDASLDQVLEVLVSRFDAVFVDVITGHPRFAELATLGEAQSRLVTLASLIEKEGRTDRDRGLISRVFHNRIARDMKLETDPTCIYSPTLYKEKPHPRYCRDPKSRYSTYVIEGLPPTPIANPGRAALDAALRPAEGDETRDLLFFVARRDGSGEHHFSRTYAEHSRAVDQYLKKRR